jgi:hypothetical protein
LEQANASTKLVSGFRRCSPGYSRHATCEKARLEAAQPVAHVGYSAWNLDTDRATWSDETYWIFGLKPQEGPIDLATLREMIHPEGRESVLRTAEEAVLAEFDPTLNIGLFAPVGRCAPCTVRTKMRLRRPPQ